VNSTLPAPTIVILVMRVIVLLTLDSRKIARQDQLK